MGERMHLGGDGLPISAGHEQAAAAVLSVYGHGNAGPMDQLWPDSRRAAGSD